MTKQIAVYCRVSSASQATASQKPDLQRWLDAFGEGVPVVWYEDRYTGRTMDRPAWNRLMSDLHAGKIAKVVVWRLDRLGRTARGLTTLFDQLPRLGVGLVSVKDGLDLETATGRLMANVLASVAQYETEIRGDRVRAGQQIARNRGTRWGGSQPGRLLFLSSEQCEQIVSLHQAGRSKSSIARACGVSRPTVYRILKQHDSS
ncbi:recombinase family protein [Stieleria sp. TO1_6]|uniref:recombinase family protein n=1 Tax=Stieleria tagensis TaxID=2956795 RepID=UPI00209BA272|nr:recombinase family protein [Stieleria tagensis]MCO8122884.1 recombinase family protein [Stieleria tagensis]